MSTPLPDRAVAPPAQRIRDAATIILLERHTGVPRVLMGQRGAKAAFLPDKFVFPGGAVDDADLDLLPATPSDPETRTRLARWAKERVAHALPYTALRELWEEAGVMLAEEGTWPNARPVPESWVAFADAKCVPRVEPLRLFFRAVTPEGRPRRFDARFFILDLSDAGLEIDAIGKTDGELSHVQWLTLAEVRALPLSFVTQVVLSELEAQLAAPDRPRRVPFFQHGADGSHFRML